VYSVPSWYAAILTFSFPYLLVLPLNCITRTLTNRWIWLPQFTELYTKCHSEVHVFSYCINIITSSLQPEKDDYLPLTGVHLAVPSRWKYSPGKLCTGSIRKSIHWPAIITHSSGHANIVHICNQAKNSLARFA